MNEIRILPVILAGGSGERLWPLSRASYPKQFLNLLGAAYSLFQTTIQRLTENTNFYPPLVICHNDYRFIIAEQLHQINTHASAIILETCANNTAPAIALAAHWAKSKLDANTLLLILPADHLIKDASVLIDTVLTASKSAREGKLVTFGIPISRAETGYGYIEYEANQVIRFIEKPDHENATVFMQKKNYLWNSGMFLFSAQSYLQELTEFAAEISLAAEESLLKAKTDLDFVRIDNDSYAKSPSISIDYAVMERTTKAAVFKLNTQWSDIGSWQAVWENSQKDSAGNYLNGDVITHNTNNCLIEARHRLVATLNVDDLIIIETADAILIATREQSQEIKHIVSKLKSSKHSCATEHRKVLRPWGWYDSLARGDNFQVKKLVVAPGHSLSLQLHHKRSEHWIVIKGEAEVIRGEEKFRLHANQSTFIPVGTKHQLSNPLDTELEIIEIQSGSYFGEDDIIRFNDIYGRVNEHESASA